MEEGIDLAEIRKSNNSYGREGCYWPIITPSNPLTTPRKIGVGQGSVFKSSVAQSSKAGGQTALKDVGRKLIPRTTLGRCLLHFCQEKGILFQSFSKRGVECPFILCCAGRD